MNPQWLDALFYTVAYEAIRAVCWFAVGGAMYFGLVYPWLKRGKKDV